jgi:hypothetical protein
MEEDKSTAARSDSLVLSSNLYHNVELNEFIYLQPIVILPLKIYNRFMMQLILTRLSRLLGVFLERFLLSYSKYLLGLKLVS